MKRLLILSLLMIIWGAEAAGGAPVQEAQRSVNVTTSDEGSFTYQAPGWSNTINNLVEALPDLDEAIPVQVTSTAFGHVQNLYQQMEQNNGLFSYVPTWLLEDSEEMGDLLLAANYLDVTFQKKEHNFDAFVKALYVAWLNADVTQAIVVRQNVVQACQQMGIDNVPAEWEQLIIDVTDCLKRGQISLNTRSGTIAYLIATGQMPAVHNGILYLPNRNLTVCDAWNIPNPEQITKLNLSQNKITALDAGAFNGLVNLTYLNLGHNQLTALPADAFTGLDHLTHLYLNNNHITTIAAGAFTGLNALTHLWLNNNHITTIAAGAFAGLDHLTNLSLNGNRITALEAGTFAELNTLIGLWLNNNQLTALPAGAFAELNALTHLYLNENQITALPADAFAGLDHLTDLSLTRNKIAAISAGAFYGLNTLIGLYISGNQLQLTNPHRLQVIRVEHPEWFARPRAAELDCTIL